MQHAQSRVIFGLGTLLLLSAFCPCLFAQEQSKPAVETNWEKQLVSQGYVVLKVAENENAVLSFIDAGNTRLMLHPTVRKELELTKSQDVAWSQQKLDTIKNCLRELKSWNSGDKTKGDLKKLKDAFASIAKEYEDSLKKALVPHQRKLVERMPLYMAITGNGIYKMVAFGPVGTKIKLTDSQREKLVEKAQEVRERLIKQMEKMEKEAIQEIFAVLEKKQRDEVMEIHNDFAAKYPPNLSRLVLQLDHNNYCDACITQPPRVNTKKENKDADRDRNLKSVLDKK